jgi:hypothetical protein
MTCKCRECKGKECQCKVCEEKDKCVYVRIDDCRWLRIGGQHAKVQR